MLFAEIGFIDAAIMLQTGTWQIIIVHREWELTGEHGQSAETNKMVLS